MGLSYCPGCHPSLPPRQARHLRRHSRTGAAKDCPSRHCISSYGRLSRGLVRCLPGLAGIQIGQRALLALADNLASEYRSLILQLI
jgi:hypothetical protein